MDNKILGWEIDDVKSLLSCIIENKDLPLTTIFKQWAKNNNRQAFSVRNYFYKLSLVLRGNNVLCERLGISYKQFVNLVKNKHFTPVNIHELLFAILPNEKFKSVRSACLNFANGNTTLMLRYQNKYKNLIKNNKDQVQQAIRELNQKNIQTRDPYSTCKIITMPSQKHIVNDDDIKNLFMGLVKLIKTNTEERLNEQYVKEHKFVNNTLRNTLVDLRRKELVIEDLKAENSRLKKDFILIQNNLVQSQAKNLSNMRKVQNLINSDKMKDLKSFLSQLCKKECSKELN